MGESVKGRGRSSRRLTTGSGVCSTTVSMGVRRRQVDDLEEERRSTTLGGVVVRGWGRGSEGRVGVGAGRRAVEVRPQVTAMEG